MAFRLLLLLACCSLAVHAMPTIRHVVVLVMENRAFDHFVGMKSTANPLIDGCRLGTTDPTCGNRYNPLNSSEPYIFVGNKAVFVQPADPGHSVPDTAEQLFGDTQTHPVDAVPPMDGFVQSYSKFNHQSSGGAFIMQCFDPVHVPVLSQLIDEYALFNAWHASIPGPTMVNRAYFDSATSYGKTDNDLLQIILGYPQRTIFQDLDENGASWKVYFQLFATSWQMAYSRAKLSNYHLFDQFKADAAAGNLPNYSFIDPRYYDFFGVGATDQHPDHDVAAGEDFIRQVYEAVRSSPAWNETLLLITYDEHGGFFDHVPPSPAPNPDGRVSSNPPFNFTRLGVRVPAVAISPWIEAGTIINAPAVGTYYDHTSVPATLHALFAPKAHPLTAREALAQPFHSHLFSGPRVQPRTDCPEQLVSSPSHRGLTPSLELDKPHGRRKISDFQRQMAAAAAALNGASDLAQIEAEIDRLVDEDAAARWVADQVNTAFKNAGLDRSIEIPPARE
jgi:phospholipase C